LTHRRVFFPEVVKTTKIRSVSISFGQWHLKAALKPSMSVFIVKIPNAIRKNINYEINKKDRRFIFLTRVPIFENIFAILCTKDILNNVFLRNSPIFVENGGQNIIISTLGTISWKLATIFSCQCN
jgi:hypothetical protein